MPVLVRMEGSGRVQELLSRQCFLWCNCSMVALWTVISATELEIGRRIVVHDQTQVSVMRCLRVRKFVLVPYLLSLQRQVEWKTEFSWREWVVWMDLVVVLFAVWNIVFQLVLQWAILYKERVAAGRDSASLPHCTILAQCSGFIVDSRFVLVVGITIDPFFSLRRWGGAAEALLNLAL